MPKLYPMSDAKAQRVLAALRAGKTLREVGERPRRFEPYCKAHPEYAREAQPLEAANARAAYLRKGAYRRAQTHCSRGHLFAEHARVRVTRGYAWRNCSVCKNMHHRRGGVMKPEVLEKVTARIAAGVYPGSLTRSGGPSFLVGFYTLARYRRENPEYDKFVVQALSNHVCFRSTSLKSPGTFCYSWNPEDQRAIASMLPDRFPGKDDVVQSIFLALLEGRLDREDVPARVRYFMNRWERQHSARFARFGDSRLVSLDEVMFDDGTATRGDMVSRGLWD